MKAKAKVTQLEKRAAEGDDEPIRFIIRWGDEAEDVPDAAAAIDGKKHKVIRLKWPEDEGD